LQVARVEKIERRVDTAFARISCLPLALVSGVEHVMVLAPVAVPAPPPDDARTGSVPPRKGPRK
jgi:rod shape-determining protein MreC